MSKKIEATSTDNVFSFPLFRSKVTRRIELGNGNWVDYYPVKTAAMEAEYTDILTSVNEVRIVNGEIINSKPRGGILDIAILTPRIANWHLEWEGEVFPYSKEAIGELSQELLSHVKKIIEASDAAYTKKETGTDDPNASSGNSGATSEAV